MFRTWYLTHTDLPRLPYSRNQSISPCSTHSPLLVQLTFYSAAILLAVALQETPYFFDKYLADSLSPETAPLPCCTGSSTTGADTDSTNGLFGILILVR
ncbi:hypothetical protein LARI1_G003086 [Lachnellula arida]|uniref:Uncharacterized protein n=1 Tax=Lachnellula arida TaxID=1316785 RepID=A0A8T9BTR1_9HELO|nr:hypothetical protein LARI1_G003086 [Lachnellula arida]